MVIGGAGGPRRPAPVAKFVISRFSRFHFYKHAWERHAAHMMSLDVDRLIKLNVPDETFALAVFIDWDISKKPWMFPRDRGGYS